MTVSPFPARLIAIVPLAAPPWPYVAFVCEECSTGAAISGANGSGLPFKAPADQVKAKAADAVAFARKQGWADQEVVIAVLVSGALLKERRFEEALKVNAHAPRAAGSRERRESWIHDGVCRRPGAARSAVAAGHAGGRVLARGGADGLTGYRS